jgi:Na+/citrate or Na+/malate symporter
MTYTEDQATGFKSEFAMRRRRQMTVVVPMLAAMIALVVLAERESELPNDLLAQVMFFIPVALLLGGIVFSFNNWRCPACRKYLGKSLSPTFCSKCGIALR